MMRVYTVQFSPLQLRGKACFTLAIILLMTIMMLMVDGSSAFPVVQQPTRSPIRSMALTSSKEALSAETTTPICVALTREAGKNEKLHQALEALEEQGKIQVVELPCIAHAEGPDLGKLQDCLANTADSWNYVAVTSPEAAKVLAGVWNPESHIQVAAVGKATQQALADHGIQVHFTPSKAYAKTLAQELPGGTGTTLLYPASCRAPGTLADGLKERGFDVRRFNTYDTVTNRWTSQQHEMSQKCQIACFASPSSIKGWLENTDNAPNQVLTACIGETSAKACRELGWDEADIFRPDSPGIPGWVNAVQDAVDKLTRTVAPTTT